MRTDYDGKSKKSGDITRRSGITPGGRKYTSVRNSHGSDKVVPSKHTEVKSGTTTWTKTSSNGKSQKNRDINKGHSMAAPGKGLDHFPGVKGPTKPKAGFGKTHTFSDGGKLRQGTTPGGRQYKAVKMSSGWSQTKVGGLAVNKSPGGGKVKINTTGNKIAKGQTKAKK